MAESATFRIRRVKCRDEMGGRFRERLGNDEIKCAVFSGDLRGSPRNSGRIDIYDNFDDGDEKIFNPPREVVTLDLAGAAGEVQLSFTVLLIESQLTEGDGLQKAWEAFVTLYEEALKEKLKHLPNPLSPQQARALAQPGNLTQPGNMRPPTRFIGARSRAEGGGVRVAGGAMAESGRAMAGGTAAGAARLDPEPDFDKELRGAFLGALVAACVAFGVKYAGAAISALIAWAEEKAFAPVAINAKIDASTAPENVPRNGTGVAEFRGHDGIYEMEWDILVR